MLYKLYLRLVFGMKINEGWRFRGRPFIRVGGKESKIVIGKRFTACSKILYNSLGVFQRVIIRTVRPGARIVIGDDVGVSGATISAAQSIMIGNRVLIGSGALITDSDAHAIDPEDRAAGRGPVIKPVVIEDDVFIGARAIVLKGVTIGRGSVIGAGAVVTRNVPAYSVAAGNPCRVLRSLRG